MNGSMAFSCDGENAARAATQAMERRGLRVMRTFDLHSAFASPADCPCPHHGTDVCTCDYLVLLVYGARPEPLVLTFHGRDGRVGVQLGPFPGATLAPANPELEHQVMGALLEAALAILATAGEHVPADGQ